MSDEVYEGAIGIDLGMRPSGRALSSRNFLSDIFTARHDLFLCC
jgi:hypothetical protein